ncbi:glycosyltransferase [Sulfitobacter sp. 916]|uniref:glycosyltransferase n=1 Tax=Sulfitobacter sp. 916 TaxID=3368559 RepID=UPI003746D30F
MKVAHITAHLSRKGYGVKNVVENLSHAQAGAGASVRVYGLSDCFWEGRDSQLWKGSEARAGKILGPRSFGYTRGLEADIVDWRPDVIHLHGTWMHPAVIAARMRKFLGVPMIVSAHGMLSPQALSYGSLKKRIAMWTYLKSALFNSTKWHATNDAERLDIQNFGIARPVIVYPNGVNILPRPFERPASRECKTVLSLGRKSPIKGLDVLLRAWALVEKEHPGWTLKVVGPDERGYETELKSISQTIGLKNVFFLPEVDAEERNELISRSDLFVLPSRSENFGLTVAESLSLGVPVITSDNTPWSEVEKVGCGISVSLNELDLATAIRDMIELSFDERLKMGEAGRLWVSDNFSWPKIADRSLSEYNQMLSVSRHAAGASTKGSFC